MLSVLLRSAACFSTPGSGGGEEVSMARPARGQLDDVYTSSLRFCNCCSYCHYNDCSYSLLLLWLLLLPLLLLLLVVVVVAAVVAVYGMGAFWPHSVPSTGSESVEAALKSKAVDNDADVVRSELLYGPAPSPQPCVRKPKRTWSGELVWRGASGFGFRGLQGEGGRGRILHCAKQGIKPLQGGELPKGGPDTSLMYVVYSLRTTPL